MNLIKHLVITMLPPFRLAASIALGLAEVQSGKGFSPASGTFSTQRINMEWADSIHEYLDNNILIR